MITLITGVPGSGKTAYALSEMLKFVGKDSVRPLYVHGIPDLKLPHEAVVCSSPSCDCCPNLPPSDYLKADQWHEWAPDGAILFFDEVQTIHRPRSSASKVPEVIAAYEIHRHRGLDFYLITQNPNLMDGNVRRLVSKHIHLTTNWMHRVQYEWPECSANVQSVQHAVKSAYKIPKHVFKLYKSASLHTKIQRKTPALAYIFIALVIFLIFGVKTFLGIALNPNQQTAKQTQTNQAHQNPNQQTQPPPTQQDLKEQQRLQLYDFKPTIPNLPQSAPAYADIAKPVTFPKLSGCLLSKKTEQCFCYTQQGTKYEVEQSLCRDYIKNLPFDPYKPDIQYRAVTNITNKKT
ncbi:zonular occludens toxin domain-containing protein [Methylosoma difficile]